MRAERIRLGFGQTEPSFGDVAGNLARAEERIREAPAFDLFALPELFASGYLFHDREEVNRLAEDASGPTVSALRKWAERGRAWIAGGFPERSGGRVFNSAALAGPDGTVHVYRKIHLFDRETVLFDEGDRPFETWNLDTAAGTVRVGLMICFDWVYPEAARCLALGGAEVILHPSNLVLGHCQDAMRTRSLENRVFSVTANRTGADRRGEHALDFTGESQIVEPRGEVLFRAPRAGEHVAVREADLALARDKRMTGRNDLFRDRRPERYENLR